MPTRQHRSTNPSAIYFTDAQQRRLRRYARDRRVTQSAVIRAAIDRALDQLEPIADVPVDVLAHMRRPFAEAAPEQTLAREDEGEKREKKQTTK